MTSSCAASIRAQTWNGTWAFPRRARPQQDRTGAAPARATKTQPADRARPSCGGCADEIVGAAVGHGTKSRFVQSDLALNVVVVFWRVELNVASQQAPPLFTTCTRTGRFITASAGMWRFVPLPLTVTCAFPAAP